MSLVRLQPRPRCRCHRWVPAWRAAGSVTGSPCGVSGLTLGRQSVEPLLTSVECLPPHSFTHDSLQQPLLALALALAPALPLPSLALSPCCHCPFFNCVCRDFTARCAFDSRQSLSLYPLPDPGEGSPKGTYEIGKVITLS